MPENAGMYATSPSGTGTRQRNFFILKNTSQSVVYKYHIVSENKGKIKKLIFGCNLEAEAAASIQPFINADIKNM